MRFGSVASGALALWSLFCGAHAAETTSALQPWPISSVQPDQEDFSDLAPFAKAIGEARVVALGEQSHGGSEEFLLKTRLLKFLHQKMGFDVLLLESGFYDLGVLAERARHGEPLDDTAPGSVFFMYANSAEGRGMLRYLDQQRAAGTPMEVAGIDAQHTGELSIKTLIPHLQAYLRRTAPALADGPAWQAYAARAEALFKMQRAAPPAVEQAAFRQTSLSLEAALCASKDIGFQGAGWWCQVVRSVQAQATSYWSGDQDYQRDNQMGANAIWLADQVFPGKKVVIWAHTIHVAKGFQRTPQNLQAGTVMQRHWGAEYKVAQFSAAHGEILDFATMKNFKLPPPQAGGLEAWLATAPQPLLGLSATAPVGLPQTSFDYGTPVPGELGVNWDILFFTRDIHPVHMTR